MSDQTVGLVGLGLIGGSIGLALRDPKREVIGFDASQKAQSIALSRFCVDRLAGLEEAAKADVVFVAVPPASVVEVSEQVLAAKGPKTVVTDCASIKSEVAAWAESRKLTHFVAGHPMAGHERGGAEFASAWLFRGARWILTPNRHTASAAVTAVERLIGTTGAKPIRLDPTVHDHHVALLSHLPHVMAAILVLMAADLESIDIAAGSWRDVTRVGGVDPGLWSQILGGNRTELARVLSEFEGKLREMRELLQEEDRARLLAVLEEAKLAKQNQDRRLPAVETRIQGVRRKAKRR